MDLIAGKLHTGTPRGAGQSGVSAFLLLRVCSPSRIVFGQGGDKCLPLVEDATRESSTFFFEGVEM